MENVCVYIWRFVSWLSLVTYISWVESSVNKQIRLNCVPLFTVMYAMITIWVIWSRPLTTSMSQIYATMMIYSSHWLLDVVLNF